MTVKFYEVKVNVTYNCRYEATYSGHLDEVLDEIKSDMKLHNFCEAEVVDAYTGEIIAEIED